MTKIVVGIAAAVIAVAAGVGLATTGSTNTETRHIENKALGVSVDLPNGWQTNHAELDAPDSTRVKVYVGAPFIDESCESGHAFTSVQVMIDEQTGVDFSNQPFGRRQSFGPSSNGGLRNGDDLDCDSRAQFTSFTERDRRFSVQVFFARDASDQHRADAYAIVNSLEIGASPWRDFCVVADGINSGGASPDELPARIARLQSLSPSRELVATLRRAATIFSSADPYAAVDRTSNSPDRQAISLILSAFRTRCGIELAVLSELLAPSPPGQAAAWEGRVVVDIETGNVTAPGFNDFIAEYKPNWAQGITSVGPGARPPAHTIAGAILVHAEGATSVGEELDEQGRSVVTVTQENLPDDSVNAIRYRLVFETGPDGNARFVSGEWAQRCQPNRGHQEFAIGACA